VRGRSAKQWWGTAIEAPDPALLADFYSRLLDWPVVHQGEAVAVVKPPQDSVFMVFQRAEGYVAPTWPPRRNLQQPGS
jgi:Glyoxalase-like domain